MSGHLRSFVSRRLSLVSVQLQVIWHKTLTSGHSIKQAFSPEPSPRSANFPCARPDDAPSQETFLPVFNAQATGNSDSELGLRVSESQTDDTRNAPAADLQPHAITITRDRETQTKGPSDETLRPYTDAGIQTEKSVPTMDQSPLIGDESEEDEDKILHIPQETSVLFEDVKAHSEAEHSHKFEQPAVLDGPIQMVITEIDSKKHAAILVTEELVKDMTGLLEESSKLDRLQGKLLEAKQKVELIDLNVRDFEESIEEAESQEEIDKLREEMSRYQSTLPEDIERRDNLQRYADIYRIEMDCFQQSILDTLRTVLTDAGLVKTHVEKIDFETTGSDEIHGDGGANQYADSEREYAADEADYSCRSPSEISIDELYRRAVNEEVGQKWTEFREAENEFDARHEQYYVQLNHFRQRQHQGPCSMTQTEFDHLDLQLTKELGDGMAAAEDAYEEAAARWHKLGGRDDDQESGFVTDEYDGYPLSWEDAGIAAAPRPFIEDWLQGIPEIEYFPDQADLDRTTGEEFEQEDRGDRDELDVRSARMSDTWSSRDLTRNRRRIERWNEIVGREK
ncbi:MAG: hypothetical protein Q9219_000935 [cf. Caloplaca sp. 3 TL-2023]